MMTKLCRCLKTRYSLVDWILW